MTFESKSVWAVLGLSFILKLCLNAFVPFAPDESYYWVWSHFLDLSYMDHPGMVAWLLAIGQIFSFIPHGERIPSIILGHLTLVVWILIANRLWSQTLTWRWLMSYLAIPFLGLGSLLVTPDVPVLFFWSLSFLFLMHWLRAPSTGLAILLGSSLGLGFCSKYHMVLFVLSFLIYVWREEPKFNQSHFYGVSLVIASGLVTSLPVIIWNFNNDWDSFRFQIRHGLGKSHWKPQWTSDYILGQFLLFSPLFWWLYLKGSKFLSLRLFFWMSFIPWIFFFFSSFRGAVQANWPIVSLAPALFLAIGAHQNWKLIKGIIVFYFFLATIVLSLWIFPWWEKAPDKLTEVHQIRALQAKVMPYQPLYGGSYQIASTLWYYSKKPVYKLRSMSRPDQFDYWEGSLPKESPYFVVREKNEPLPDWLIKSKAPSMVILDLGRYELVKVSP